jgi:hypothetical protein
MENLWAKKLHRPILGQTRTFLQCCTYARYDKIPNSYLCVHFKQPLRILTKN